MDEYIKKADVLIEALPYIKRFYDKTIVIKYGGSAMHDKALRRSVLEDVVFLNYVGMQPVLVHGGGTLVTPRMEAMGKKVEFVKGFRVTDEETMQIVESEFMRINREIVKELTSLGTSAISLSGRDDHFIEVKKHPPIDGKDLGYVGEIQSIDTDVLGKMLTTDIIPVIPPVGVGVDDHAYNINADQVAAEIAASLGAAKLVVLTNVRGVMKDVNNPDSLLYHASSTEIEALIKSGAISAGMIPKVNACLRALQGRVEKAHIVDVKIPHALLLEIFTDRGIGTEIV